jgi:hypothetical protein
MVAEAAARPVTRRLLTTVFLGSTTAQTMWGLWQPTWHKDKYVCKHSRSPLPIVIALIRSDSYSPDGRSMVYDIDCVAKPQTINRSTDQALGLLQ